MRRSVSDNGFTLRAFAGTTGVLLAFDVGEALREGLLGFAVQRRASGRKWQWLTGKLGWAGEPVSERTYFPSNERPLQKFRWSDYRVEPGRSYAYRVHPVHGTPAALRIGDPLSVSVRAGTLGRRTHSVLFNRAAAASQAFSLKFPDVERRMDEARAAGEDLELPPDVREWLSRGVLDQIVGMVDRATGPRSGLDIAIYEYEHPEIVAAVDRAVARGVDVRVVYHARSGDPQTAENEHHLGRLGARARPRVTSKIMHDKFIVLSRVSRSGRTPRAVLCGSTNFTENGVYRQANVVHVVEDEAVAGRYAAVFDLLFSGATVKETRAWIDQHNPVALDAPVSVGFSPRSAPDDLDALAARIRAARRDVLFCTAFDLEQRVLDALLGDPGDDVIRLGVQNKRSSITGYHRDRSAQFAATALLSKGLEGFLKESLARQRGSILIHTKLVVVDFTTDAPFVISGSHNLSKSASSGNDENFLAVSGDTGVADDYGVELMRVYDHYRFRWNMKQPRHQVPALTRDDRWTRRYFEPDTLPFRDRCCFSGQAG